jgi:hypothetical protein
MLYNAAPLIKPGALFFKILPDLAPAAFSPLPTWGLFAEPPAPLQNTALILGEVSKSEASHNP